MISQRRTRCCATWPVHAASLAESWQLAARVLAEADLDVPFALFQQLDEAGCLPRSMPVPDYCREDRPRWPWSRVDLTQPATGWPLAEKARPLAADRGRGCRFPGLICLPYLEPIKAAAVLPITPPGGDRPVCARGRCQHMAAADRSLSRLLRPGGRGHYQRRGRGHGLR